MMWPAILATSLVGSVHCLAMCGPLVGLAGARSVRLALIHALGRLLTYSVLGAAAGGVGRAVDLAGELGAVSRIATFVAGGAVILWGLFQFAVAFGWARDPKMKSTLFKSSLVQIGTKRAATRAWLVGVLTGLLPCGWLWAFVITAAGTGSPLAGAAVMVVFWLGTVPAMTGAFAIGDWLKRRMPLVTAAVLVVLGLVTLANRAPYAGTPHCHCHQGQR